MVYFTGIFSFFFFLSLFLRVVVGGGEGEMFICVTIYIRSSG